MLRPNLAVAEGLVSSQQRNVIETQNAGMNPGSSSRHDGGPPQPAESSMLRPLDGSGPTLADAKHTLDAIEEPIGVLHVGLDLIAGQANNRRRGVSTIGSIVANTNLTRKAGAKTVAHYRNWPSGRLSPFVIVTKRRRPGGGYRAVGQSRSVPGRLAESGFKSRENHCGGEGYPSSEPWPFRHCDVITHSGSVAEVE
jgi:hypothetical protein